MENIVFLSLRALGAEAPKKSWLRSLAYHTEEGIRSWLKQGRPPPVPGSVSDHPRLVRERLETLLYRLSGLSPVTAECSTARALVEGCLMDLSVHKELVSVLFPDKERVVTMLYPWHPPWEAYPESWITSHRDALALHVSFFDAVTGMVTCRENILDAEKTRVVNQSFENLLVRVASYHGVAGFTSRDVTLARHEAICLVLRAAREQDAAGAARNDAARGDDASPPGAATR